MALVILTKHVRFRVIWTLLSVFVVECLVFGLAVLPGALFWELFALQTYPFVLVRIVVLSMAFVPAYGLFAFSLMVLSALSTRWLGWRTPADAEMSIRALEWPLLCWVRYMVSVHVVRLFAGSVFRATPLWTFYLRLNGARLGRGVYVNSLAVNDHNLLEFGHRVVIGDGVHLSGHTVERGIVKTAAVRLGDDVTIGLGTVVGIGVEAGPRCQVGALSLVPKFSRLRADTTYVGAPVRELRPGRGASARHASARSRRQVTPVVILRSFVARWCHDRSRAIRTAAGTAHPASVASDIGGRDTVVESVIFIAPERMSRRDVEIARLQKAGCRPLRSRPSMPR